MFGDTVDRAIVEEFERAKVRDLTTKLWQENKPNSLRDLNNCIRPDDKCPRRPEFKCTQCVRKITRAFIWWIFEKNTFIVPESDRSVVLATIRSDWHGALVGRHTHDSLVPITKTVSSLWLKFVNSTKINHYFSPILNLSDVSSIKKCAISKKELPSPRVIGNIIKQTTDKRPKPDRDSSSNAPPYTFSLFGFMFAQFLTHDMGNRALTKTPGVWMIRTEYFSITYLKKNWINI